ncbi:MAG TPA: phage baseplate assembly protein V [Acidimicrobiales bacterium]|nr:phage baseplate assembly protein V [Acidimicrobiales bacterium]
MATGFGGTYKAVVLDNQDPSGENRLNVSVPDVGIDSAWAKPLDGSSGAALPAVADEVLVQFEGGDTDHPVWHRDGVAAPARPNYPGVYQGTVVDNLDPEQANRLNVQVPDVLGYESVWAAPGPSVGSGGEPPAVGAGVWVEFEGGDSDHPRWTGVR